MITEVFILLLFKPLLVALDNLPAIEVTIPDDAFQNLKSSMQTLGYILPIEGLLPILVTKISVKVARVVMAVVIRVKSFIPTMGA